MSGARRRSKSLWDNQEEAIPQTNTSPKHSISEAHDVFMTDDFSREPTQANENIPYRGDNRGPRNMSKDRDRSRSPPRNRARERDRDRDRDRGIDERRESYESGDIRNDSKSSSHRPGNSRFRDDRNRDTDGYRKDEEPRDYNKGSRNAYDDQDHRRSSTQSIKPPCRFFMMGNCNRNRCKFSHDVPKSEGYEVRSHDNNDNDNNRPPQPYDHVTNSNRNLDDMSHDNNIGKQDFSQYMSLSQFPTNLNGDEKSMDMNGSNGVFLHTDIQKEMDNIQNKESGKVLEASRYDIPSETVSMPEKKILADALELLNSLPNSAPSNAPVSDIKTSVVPVGIVDSGEQGNQKAVESVENKKDENLKNTNTGKVEEGDEKAMRQFKIVLVEFVKEILKPTWKEGKMSREVYKTIVKKVVEKVTSSIQGVQIPRTQEKIDQYLAFSKSKITKLVEAYVGRLLKA